MRKALRYISLCVMSLLAFAGCDVHEFPEERYDQVPFLLHIDFDDTDMPLHQEVIYTRNGEAVTKSADELHDIRYTINAYRTDNVVGVNQVADATFVFTKSDLSNLDYTAPLYLNEGSYRFAVWCDYVSAGSTEDKYYDTSNFVEVILKNKDKHSGNNPFRDVFKGHTTATVTNPAYYTGEALKRIDNQATVEMSRPVGKVQFISTDVEEFLTRIANIMQQQGLLSAPLDKNSINALLQSLDLSQFKVIVKYDLNMPCSYDMIYDKMADSWRDMSFESGLKRINDTEMSLGFDYVFVDDFGTTLNMSVEVYNNQGELMSRSKSVPIPIVPGKLTTVRGEFLTSIATGGVGINPGYEGDDYNRDITDLIQ